MSGAPFRRPQGDPAAVRAAAAAIGAAAHRLGPIRSRVDGTRAATAASWSGAPAGLVLGEAGEATAARLAAAPAALEAAAATLAEYARALADAQARIDDLATAWRTQAERLDALTSSGADPASVTAARDHLQHVEDEAADVLRVLRAADERAASALDVGTSAIVPAAGHVDAATLYGRTTSAWAGEAPAYDRLLAPAIGVTAGALGAWGVAHAGRRLRERLDAAAGGPPRTARARLAAVALSRTGQPPRRAPRLAEPAPGPAPRARAADVTRPLVAAAVAQLRAPGGPERPARTSVPLSAARLPVSRRAPRVVPSSLAGALAGGAA